MRTLAATLFVLGAGCDYLPEQPDWESGFTPVPGEPAQVAGRWTIEGEGSRSDCDDDLYDVDRFRLSSAELRIAQDGDALSLQEAVPGFELYEGQVQGDRVEFRTWEATPQGELTFDFDGDVEGTRNIAGSFAGRGPAGCRSSGTFTVFVEPAE